MSINICRADSHFPTQGFRRQTQTSIRLPVHSRFDLPTLLEGENSDQGRGCRLLVPLMPDPAVLSSNFWYLLLVHGFAWPQREQLRLRPYCPGPSRDLARRSQHHREQRHLQPFIACRDAVASRAGWAYTFLYGRSWLTGKARAAGPDHRANGTAGYGHRRLPLSPGAKPRGGAQTIPSSCSRIPDCSTRDSSRS